MSETAVFIRHRALPGRRDDVMRVWDRYARAYVDGYRGQLAYFYCYDDSDPDTVLVFQLCTDRAAAEDFMKQPWFAAYQAETAALLAGASEIRMAAPRWVKGAAA